MCIYVWQSPFLHLHITYTSLILTELSGNSCFKNNSTSTLLTKRAIVVLIWNKMHIAYVQKYTNRGNVAAHRSRIIHATALRLQQYYSAGRPHCCSVSWPQIISCRDGKIAWCGPWSGVQARTAWFFAWPANRDHVIPLTLSRLRNMHFFFFTFWFLWGGGLQPVSSPLGMHM
jgi:hypothetical protein